jgi:exodeoxyribonuclease-3
MKLVTWNVNSIRVRQERLLAFLGRHGPDVVCLQELKVEDAKYPHALLEAAGYRSVVHGQKTYNGVAILSRLPATDVRVGLDDGDPDPQARLVSAVIGGVRVASVYVPNGSEVGSEKWAYKRAFYGRLRAWLDRHVRPDEPFALCGDFNVAPAAIDVHDPAAWENDVLFHPDARADLDHVSAFGLVDTLRQVRGDEPGLFSWWDYRMLAFPKNRGVRIDHILATRPLAERCVEAFIDRDERKGDAPSDHAPVVVTFRE